MGGRGHPRLTLICLLGVRDSRAVKGFSGPGQATTSSRRRLRQRFEGGDLVFFLSRRPVGGGRSRRATLTVLLVGFSAQRGVLFLAGLFSYFFFFSGVFCFFVELVASSPSWDQIISYYNSSHTRIKLKAAAARGLDCCRAAGSYRGALCKKRERNVYPLRAEKPGLHQNLTYVRGDRGCRNPIPGDVSEARGFALSVPKAKKV